MSVHEYNVCTCVHEEESEWTHTAERIYRKSVYHVTSRSLLVFKSISPLSCWNSFENQAGRIHKVEASISHNRSTSGSPILCTSPHLSQESFGLCNHGPDWEITRYYRMSVQSLCKTLLLTTKMWVLIILSAGSRLTSWSEVFVCWVLSELGRILCWAINTTSPSLNFFSSSHSKQIYRRNKL